MPTETTEKSNLTSARAAPRSKAPVFVLGCPRSGTTLLYHMLLSAGNFVVYRAESQVFNLLEPRFGDLRVPGNRRKLLTAWENSSLFTKTGLEADQIERDVMENCENAGDFLRIVMESMARKQGVERWAETTPDHLLALPRIKQTIPNALVIHIIRDGRDVALSLEKQHWIRPFPWDHGKELLSAAVYWEWIVNEGRRHGQALGNDYKEVRYEELVANPRATLAEVGRFIGQDLDYDQIQRVGIGSVSRPNSSFGGEQKSGGFHPVARWKNSLSKQQLTQIEGLIGQTLDALGYERAATQRSEEPPTAQERMRSVYHTYFNTKLALKTKTPLGRLVGGDLQFLGGQAEVPAQSSEAFQETVRVLQIGNYPPPMCGWAIQLKLVTEELRRRGHVCEVLKINEGRQIKSSEYIDVQSGPDYLKKIIAHALRGYRLNVHVNGMSKKGYWLAMAAALTGRFVNRPALVTFHGGLSQDYFPRHDHSLAQRAFYALFRMAGEVACDSEPIREAIIQYGIRPEKVTSIATFSPQYLDFARVELADRVAKFLREHPRVMLSYVSFRPEYRLDVLREGMRRYRAIDPEAGFVWLGFPGKEMPAAEQFVAAWPAEEQASLLLLGNLNHDEFLSLLSRCFLYLRTPACDGVAASVLESLALKIPVVASENGRRPAGVITYEDMDPADMVEKLRFTREHYNKVKESLQSDAGDDNVGRMADWLVGNLISAPQAVSNK
ncbi:MAG TPA: sulfotransferase [Terriglobales bacterium]|nr:sulfotransferase [Terriglobales bacterium]